MLLFMFLSVLLNYTPIVHVASSDVYEIVKEDDYMKRPPILRNNLYANAEITDENLPLFYGDESEHDFYAEYAEDVVNKVANEKDKNTASGTKDSKHRTKSKLSRDDQSKLSLPPSISRRVLKWLNKIIGKDGRFDSNEAGGSSDENGPLVELLMKKSNTKTLQLEKNDTSGDYILEVPISIDFVPKSDSRKRRKRETNETENAYSTVAPNTTENEANNTKDTNSTATVEVNKDNKNNTDECTRNKNLRRFDITNNNNNGEIEMKAVVKDKILSYIQNTLDDIQAKVDSVQSIKMKFTSHKSFYIGYLLANIDVMGRKVVKIRDWANENGGEWSERKLFSILDSLQDSEKFILKLLQYLRRYLS